MPSKHRDQVIVAIALAYEALAYVQRAAFGLDDAGQGHLDLAEVAVLLRQAVAKLEDIRGD